MYAILTHTKETIALKKKQIEENQGHVNNMTFEMANRVQTMFRLKNEVEVLEREMYRLEKQLHTEEQNRKTENANGCSIGASPMSDRCGPGMIGSNERFKMH